MATKTIVAVGLTKAQFARKFGVDQKTVQEWIDQGRLDVVRYVSKEPFGRSGKEPLLILITNEDRPERRVPSNREAP